MGGCLSDHKKSKYNAFYVLRFALVQRRFCQLREVPNLKYEVLSTRDVDSYV